ncbi:MAG: hypothetical protein EOO15_09170 [Chitinophagaceae bacterium]|nr:MAG: hypothetical protein EOO15_09170 [Chitinophagaceae bacterium]
MTTLLNDCHTILRELTGDAPLYFESALQVKLTPHSPALSAWAVAISADGSLQVMDAEEQWHPFSPEDRNAALVLGSLYQRLRMLRMHYGNTG